MTAALLAVLALSSAVVQPVVAEAPSPAGGEPAPAASAVFTVEVDESTGAVSSSNGVVLLSWEAAAGAPGEFELQQSLAGDFSDARTRYRGGDGASHLTGLPEGAHHFRVRAGEGEWSAPLRVEVEFVERWKLALLLAGGFAVAAATVGAVLAGHFRRKEGAE